MKFIKVLARMLVPSVLRRYYKCLRRLYHSRAQARNVRERFNVIPSIIRKDEIDLILFLVLDCLRKDHLSVYGYERDTCPFLKESSQEGAVFTDAVSPSNWTYPSVISILTGMYPHSHGGTFFSEERHFSKDRMPLKPKPHLIWLQYIMSLLDFDTFFMSSIATSAIPVEGRFKYSFCKEVRAQAIMKELTERIGYRKRKKFFYVQLGDLHEPINPPQRYWKAFDTISGLPNIKRWDFLHNPPDNDNDFIDFKMNKIKLYDSTITYLDEMIEKLFTFLAEKGMRERSIIVLTSDHGEEFWDHKEMEFKNFFDPRKIYGCGHGHSFFQEVVSVPLILYNGENRVGPYHHRVSLVDIVPTLMKMLRIKSTAQFDGRELFSSDNERIIISEENAYGYDKLALFYKTFKLLYSPLDDIEWYFDLKSDPKECTPQTVSYEKQFEVMRNCIKAIRRGPLEGKASTDEKMKKQLEQLGYF